MTREEAIKELNTFKTGAKSELGENALDMAIKALEKQDRIAQILDNYDLDTWEVLEMVKEAMKK